jgi:protein PhnA
MEPKDSNGNILQAGDTAMVIKTLKVKGGSSDIKQGTVVKNIRLTDDDEAVEGKVNGSTIVLKTMFLKKK